MFISITPGTNQSRKKRISCSGSIFVTFTYMHLTVKVITLKELIKHRHCWKVSARKRVQKHIRCVDILQNIKKRPQQVEKIQQTNSDIIKNWGSTPKKQRKSGENKKDQVTENHAGKMVCCDQGWTFSQLFLKVCLARKQTDKHPNH